MAFLQRGSAIVVTVPAGQSIAVGALRGSQAQVLIPSGLSGGPIGLVNNSAQTFGPFINGASISVSCISGTAEYVVDVAPVLTDGSVGVAAANSVATASFSATIAVASTSQVLMPANSSRSGFSFQNNSIYLIGLNLTGGAASLGAGSILIMPGQSYTSNSASVSSAQVSIFCGRAGAAFNCAEYTSILGAAPAKAATDRSGLIAVSGKAQSLLPVNAARLGFIIQNISKFPMQIQETVDGTLTGVSRKIAAFDMITSDDFGASTAAFSIICRAFNAPYTALEY
jgi:hypothetical protein